MAKLESLIEKPFSGEWGLDDENGIGIPVLRTTNFTNEGVINYEKIVTRIISSSKLTTGSNILKYLLIFNSDSPVILDNSLIV